MKLDNLTEEQKARGIACGGDEAELGDEVLDGIAGGMRTGGYDDPKWTSECPVCGKAVQVSAIARHYEACHKKR